MDIPTNNKGDYDMRDPQIIIITYNNGSQHARFRDDAELLDTLIYHHDDIGEVQVIPFEGNLCITERSIRKMIRCKGKEETRKILEKMLQDTKK